MLFSAVSRLSPLWGAVELFNVEGKYSAMADILDICLLYLFFSKQLGMSVIFVGHLSLLFVS